MYDEDSVNERRSSSGVLKQTIKCVLRAPLSSLPKPKPRGGARKEVLAGGRNHLRPKVQRGTVSHRGIYIADAIGLQGIPDYFKESVAELARKSMRSDTQRNGHNGVIRISRDTWHDYFNQNRKVIEIVKRTAFPCADENFGSGKFSKGYALSNEAREKYLNAEMDYVPRLSF